MSIKPDLTVNIGGLELQNPVMTASGTFGYAREFDHLVDLNRLGGIIVKGLSLKPTRGNPPPRIVETPCGMLNAIGLENVGIEAFVADKLPFLQRVVGIMGWEVHIRIRAGWELLSKDIRGVGREYALLLQRVGVDCVEDLAKQDPGELHEMLAAEKQSVRTVRRLPPVQAVRDWVGQAKDITVGACDKPY